MGITRILKWIFIGMVIIFVLVVALIGGLLVFSNTLAGSAPPPLQLPSISSTQQNTGAVSLDGTWVAEDGSLAGFRVGVGQRSTIVGRTSAVTGSLVISQDEIVSGSFQVDLTRLTIAGQQNISFFKLLETKNYPEATITLTKPVAFQSIPTDGQTFSLKVPATLAIHGITREVTLNVKARKDGSVLQAVGSAPMLASDWNVKSPFAVHNEALIEFLLVLRRS